MDTQTINTDLISEQRFLLTELRYTLGQLHVQLGDLVSSDDQASEETSGIDQVIRQMFTCEREYQEKYARHLGVQPPAVRTFEDSRDRDDFEEMRQETITLLETVEPEQWPQPIVDLVKQQVDDDRRYTTQIADERRHIFEHPTRPDLLEPLTDHPAPEIKEDLAR